MTLDELVAALKHLADELYDPEADHAKADKLLLQYINDERVTEAYHALERWYE